MNKSENEPLRIRKYQTPNLKSQTNSKNQMSNPKQKTVCNLALGNWRLFVLCCLVFGYLTISSSYKHQDILEKKWVYSIQDKVFLPQPSGWHSTLPWLISSPAISDLSGDKNLEIVTGTEEGYNEWFPDGVEKSGRYICIDSNGKFAWDYKTDNNAGRASPNIYEKKILGGSTSGWMVHYFDENGKRLWRFECDNKANVLSSPAIADVLEDKAGLEIAAVDLDGNLYLISQEGKLIWKKSLTIKKIKGAHTISSPIIYDFENDKKPEIIACTASGIFCLDGSGEILWQGPYSAGYSSPAIVPATVSCHDAHSGKDVMSRIITTSGGTISCLSPKNGDVLWQVKTGRSIFSSPSVGDVDGDGSLDVIIPADKKVLCLDSSNGNEKWAFGTKGEIYSSPALADRYSDTAYRIEWGMFRANNARTGYYGSKNGPLDIYVGSDDGYVYLINGRSGKEISRYQISFPDLLVEKNNRGPLKFMSSPVVADIDGDGLLEVIFTLVDKIWCLTDKLSSEKKPEVTHKENKVQFEKNLATITNEFTIAQIVTDSDWNPAVPVYSVMLKEISKRLGIKTATSIRHVAPEDKQFTSYPFLYLTGHNKFEIKSIEKLKSHLKNGAFLFAESCCSAKEFDESFRKLASDLFPDSKLEKLADDHELFNCYYKLDQVEYRKLGKNKAHLEGIVVDKNLVVVYSKYDIACSWGNKHCPDDCISLASEDSLKLFSNIVVYHYR